MDTVDRLFDAVSKKGPVCVGLDTAPEYIPSSVLSSSPGAADAVWRYNRALIDGTFDVCACYKVQVAYYEALGLSGMAVFARTLSYLRDKNLLSIADIKRGDIADTAVQYARAYFDGEFEADAVTLSPYMGMDSIQPWVEAGEKKGKGAFVLMRTSNGGMRDFQYRKTAGGEFFYDLVGSKMAALAEEHRGRSGYGRFGIVVGCTERGEAAAIRATYGKLFFLIPGYGAQGGAAEDAARLLIRGNGGVVNASRSILCAWKKDGIPLESESDAQKALYGAASSAREACLTMKFDIERAVKAQNNGECDGCSGEG